MKSSILKLSVAALALTACSSGSSVQYFVVGAAQFTVPQGTNCGGLSNGACSIAQGGGNCTETSTQDTQAVWAIDPASSGGAYLEGALPSSTVLVGSQSGSGYTFAGKLVTTDTNGNTTTTDEKDVTVSLTLAGAGFTGTVTQEEKISDPDSSSDCTQTAQLIASQVSAQEVEQIDPTVNANPVGSGGVGSSGGGNGNGNGTGNGTGTGGGGWSGTFAAQAGGTFDDNGETGNPPSGSESISQSGSAVTWSNFAAPSMSCGALSLSATGNTIDLSGVVCGGFTVQSGSATLNSGVITVSAFGSDSSANDFELDYSLQ